MDQSVSLILFLCILGFYNLSSINGNEENDALNAQKKKFGNPKVMDGWDMSLVSPCTWPHITCTEDRVDRINLGNSNLSGELASELGRIKNLRHMDFYNNNITGTIPKDFGNLTNLKSLDLFMNHLEGEIPVTLGKLQKLNILNLNNNNLSGTIPISLTTIESLNVINLSNNNLSGVVPMNGSFSRFTNISFDNNPNLIFRLPPPSAPAPPIPKSHSVNTGAIAGGVATAAALLIVVPGIVIALHRRKKLEDHFFDLPGEEEQEIQTEGVKRFNLREIQVATDNFSNTNVLGKGGFGKVYKGRLTDGSLVAVKRLKEERTQGGELQFQTEVETISLAIHKNLLKLIGFCMTPTERILVFPLMVNGSVASCLRDRPATQAALDWQKRKQIALGSAKGLAYLHEHCDPKIIHRDVKAANILLDEEFRPVVGDFGLAKLMDYKETHVTTAVRGTLGHIAPEYLSTGRSSVFTDVFGYGVMLLEIVTGQRAFDLARLANDDEVMLLDWVKDILIDKKLEKLVDEDLDGNYVEEEVERMIQIALLCTQSADSERPKMTEVVSMLEGNGLEERWEAWQKDELLRKEYASQNPNPDWFTLESNYEISAEPLSGPR